MKLKNLLTKISQHWFLAVLALFIIWGQIVILAPHFKYGLGDVDWGFLSIYKTQDAYSPSQFIKNLSEAGTRGGVYTHQIFYIGILGDLFGLDFESYHMVTHTFKILSVLFSFPVFLFISQNILIASLSIIIFGFSSPTVGTLYTVVTSSDYLALFAMEVFVIIYWYLIKNNITKTLWLLVGVIFMVMTLFLSTERMYPLPLYIVLTELFIFLFNRNSRTKVMVKRLLILISPMLLAVLLRPYVFLSFFLTNGIELGKRIGEGDWNLLLTPLIALGSIVVSHEYTKYLGLPNLESLMSFINFFISGPLPILFFTTILIGMIIFRNSFLKFSLQTLLLTSVFSLLLYIVGSHSVRHQLTEGSIVQALVGLYILAMSIVVFRIWLKNQNKKEKVFHYLNLLYNC